MSTKEDNVVWTNGTDVAFLLGLRVGPVLLLGGLFEVIIPGLLGGGPLPLLILFEPEPEAELESFDPLRDRLGLVNGLLLLLPGDDDDAMMVMIHWKLF